MKALHSDDVARESAHLRKRIADAYSEIAMCHSQLAAVYDKYNWNLHAEGAEVDAGDALKQREYYSKG